MGPGQPMFDPKLVKKPEYSIEDALWENNDRIKDAAKLVVYPIEAGNRLVIAKKDDIALISAPLTEIQAGKVQETKGRFVKKEDLWLKLVLDTSQNKKEVLVNVNDKHVDEILNTIMYYKALDKEYWKNIDIMYYNHDQLSTSKVYYRTPFLAEGETLLWSFAKTAGIINKHIEFFAALTNFRAIVYDFKETHDSGRIFLSNVDEIVVANQHRVSESNSSGMYSRGRYGVGVYSGSSSGTSHTVGEVMFMNDGMPIVTFGPIADPHGLARIARAAMKDIKRANNEFEKLSKATEREKEFKIASKTRSKLTAEETETVTEIACPSCKVSIPTNANFCNNCGAKLKFICSKCGVNNPEGSKFCNGCGMPLS